MTAPFTPPTPGVIEAAKRLADYADLMAERAETSLRERDELDRCWARNSIMKGANDE